MVKVPFIRLVTVLCGNGGQRGIKTSSYFQKSVFINLKKIELGKKEQVFEKLCGHRPQTYPNIPKQLVAPGREGCGDPRPCTSRERLVTIPNVPMVAPGVFYLSGSQWRQNANLQLVEIVQAKKKLVLWPWSGYLCNFSWKAVKSQMLEGIWDDGSASGNCVTLVSGLRSMALVTWRSLKIEKPHCDASEAADTCQEWWFPIPPFKSWVALTFCLKQREPVRFFLTSGFSLRRQITYAPLGLDTYQ